MAFPGGMSCPASLTVEVSEGERSWVDEKHRETLEQIQDPDRNPTGRLRVRESSSFRLEEDATALVADFLNPVIDGFFVDGVFRAESGTRVAVVSGYGCIIKESPRRKRWMEGGAKLRAGREQFSLSRRRSKSLRSGPVVWSIGRPQVNGKGPTDHSYRRAGSRLDRRATSPAGHDLGPEDRASTPRIHEEELP